MTNVVAKDLARRVMCRRERGLAPPRPDLETDASRDELACARVPQAELPRDVADGVRCCLAPPDGSQNLCNDPPNARWRVRSNGEQDLDRRRRWAQPVAPGVVVDIWAEAAVSWRRFLLGLPLSPV